MAGGSDAGARGEALAAATASVNSRSSCGSTLWNVDAADAGSGSGSAISSVSSNTSPSGCGGRTSSSGVASSRLASMASMSSWLLGAATAGGGAGFGAGAGAAAAGALAGCAAGIADGGMSFIAGLAGGTAAADAAAAALSPGLASSSAMMRRIDAKISSIEGSWTFAGCVISDSTSSTANLHQATADWPVPGVEVREFRCARLTCPQIKRDALSRPAPCPVMTSNHDGRSTQSRDPNRPAPRARLRHVGNCASKRGRS